MLPDERTDPAGGGIGPGDLLGSGIESDSTDAHRQLLAAALDYAANEWEVIACRAHDVDERRRAKAPLTRNGHHDATTDPAVIMAMWSDHPDAIIGAKVPDAVVVLDIDPRNGGTVAAVEEASGATLPTTLTVYSGRADGGRHLYYLRPSGLLTSTRLPPGIDLKVHGYCIVPPSRHPATGLPYVWDYKPVVAMSPGLRELLRPAPPAHAVISRTRRPSLSTGSRTGRSAALLRTVGAAGEGSRNAVLFWAAARAAEGGFLPELAEQLVDAAVGVGLSRTEATRTISSAATHTRASR